MHKLGYQPMSYEVYFPALFRARKITAKSVDDVTNNTLMKPKDFSYPPAGLGVAGRCNLQGYPVFYSSTDNGVALFEVRPEVGDFVAISEVRNQSTTDNRIPVAAIGVDAIVSSLTKRNPNDTMAKLFSGSPIFSSSTPELLRIDHNLTEWFTRIVNASDTLTYRLTTGFYRMYTDIIKTDDNDRFHVLVYPSVESDVTGYNVVMETGIADNHFAFDRAYLYQVKSRVGKDYELEVLKTTEFLPNGDINWIDDPNKGGIWSVGPDTNSFYH